ncbi:MAG: UDP-3-O-(3-hydroxymyristoyl)glucosamine N-acyltransferase [Candidatus Omnitrophica bacterium]|nr:UDP-3-O-(3-hydroxymyristoyl)glucosamine N-acyltransferase [Candidatus Omnitrophota bacterium]
MEYSLATLAERVNGRVIGDGSIRISGLNGAQIAHEGELTFAEDERHFGLAMASRASAILVSEQIKELGGRSGIAVKNPKLVFAQLLELFYPQPLAAAGVHPTAVLGKSVALGPEVSIGPHAVLGDGVRIGQGTRIESGAHVGQGTTIGEYCFIGPNVSIYYGTHIGHRVRIHAGSVIGGDGFGYVLHEGRHVKVPQVGNVIIEDDVELGSNVCVDRATIGSTIIRQGTKIDNLVQIAHNDHIGQHVVMAGQVGLAGSVTVGDYVVMGGQAGAVDHVTIGARAQVGAASPVIKSVAPGETVWGFPARPVKEAKEQIALVGRLPVWVERLKQLLGRVDALEKRVEQLPGPKSSS